MICLISYRPRESIYCKQEMFFEFLLFLFPLFDGGSGGLVVCSAVHASHACARYGVVGEWRIWNLCRAFFFFLSLNVDC